MTGTKAKSIPLSKAYADCKDLLHLSLLNHDTKLDVLITQSDISRPGLLLAGFGSGFQSQQIQILGDAEVLFLDGLSSENQAEAFGRLLDEGVPCIIIAGSMTIPAQLVTMSSGSQVPVLVTPMTATQVIHYLNSYLLAELAPEITLNGTLVDVDGVGILLVGKSGIGKSECALDLVERGHRLVADDLVRTIAMPPGILIGRSSEPLQNFVEVRGVGLIDIGSIYGIRALRRQKRIEVEVNLREWQQGFSYDRSGLERAETEILGVRIPSITVPLVPGKNVSTVVEVVALSHILRLYGYDAPSALDEKWLRRVGITRKPRFEPRDKE